MSSALIELLKSVVTRWAIAWLTRKLDKLKRKIAKVEEKLDKKRKKQTTSEYIDEEGD